MKYDTAVLAALVASATSVHGAAIQARPAPVTDSVVTCMQRSFPGWPKGGDPIKEQNELHACLPRLNAVANPESIAARNASDTTLVARGWLDDIKVLGDKVMGIDQKPQCRDYETGEDSKLRAEFAWPQDVIKLARDIIPAKGKDPEKPSLCDTAMDFISKHGINENGGVGYAEHVIDNAFWNDNNYLRKGRHITLMLYIDYYPPAKLTVDSIQQLSKGVLALCGGSVERLMTRGIGCTDDVKWYGSGKMEWPWHEAAKEGEISMFMDGSNNKVATVRVGFAGDTDV